MRNWKLVICLMGVLMIGGLVHLDDIEEMQQQYKLGKELQHVMKNYKMPEITIGDNEVHLDGGDYRAREKVEKYLRKEYIVKDVRNLNEFDSKVIILKKGM